jgi:hypothetical protein
LERGGRELEDRRNRRKKEEEEEEEGELCVCADKRGRERRS